MVARVAALYDPNMTQAEPGCAIPQRHLRKCHRRGAAGHLEGSAGERRLGSRLTRPAFVERLGHRRGLQFDIQIRREIESAPASRRLMIIGHNPGLQDFALEHADPAVSDKEALHQLDQKFPTAALAVLQRKSDGKDDAAPAGGFALTALYLPRTL